MTLAFLFLTVAFLFLSSPLCYMLRFVSLPNKRRYIYIYTSILDKSFAVPPRAPKVAVPSAQLNGVGVTLCSFSPYFQKPGPCILGGWTFCVEWPSIGTAIAPQESFRYFLL